MGRPGYWNISSLADVRRIMAQLINERQNDKIGNTKYRDLFYGLKCIREVLEAMFIQSEVVERLMKLEGTRYVPPRASFDDNEDDDRWNA